MINTMDKLINSWYSLLSGHLTYNSVAIPVYKEDTPMNVTGNYVLLRSEGETRIPYKDTFADRAVVIVDIVTVFENAVNTSVANNIDGQILSLLYTSPSKHNLTSQTGMNILNVIRETTSYLTEDTKVKTYFRKITRFNHIIQQQ